MKGSKFYIWMLLFFLAGISQGCESWLEIEPDQGLTIGEYWQSKEDVEATLMAAYRNFALMDEDLFLYGELRGDMIEAGTAVRLREDRILNNNITPDNITCKWDKFYKVIHHCNLILENSDAVLEADPNFTLVTLKSLKAEALFLRSLSYFYLVRVFKNVPYVTHSSETDDTDFFLPASEENAIIDSIKLDLETAIQYMPVNQDFGSIAENKGRASYGAIYALLADIYLWNFEYQNCIDAIAVIEQQDKFHLISPGDWFDLFYPGNSLESIFEFQFDQATNLNNKTYQLSYGTNRFNVSDYALELLDPENSNEIIRGNGSICTEFNYFNNKNSEFVWKYCGTNPDGRSIRPSSENNSANFIVYRYADILLMKAEALSQLNQYQEALALINEIRLRASMPLLNSVLNTPNSFEDIILEERAKEFAYEGKRWFDLLRMGRRNDYSRADDLIEIMVRNVPAAQKRILATRLADPMGWYFPIFDEELERNKLLIQNPYYQQFSRE